MKRKISKKVLIASFIITLFVGFIIAAGINPNKKVIKKVNISTNMLLGMKESPLIHVEENTNPLIFNTVDEMINFYSKVFMVKNDIMNDVIYNLIKQDFKSWNNDNALNGITYNSKELAILKTIADIYSNPSKYGLNKNEIEVKDYELKDIKPEEFVYKFSIVLDVNPYIALAIAYCECGYKLQSYNFINKHNIGGIKGKNGYARYKNEAYGIYKYINMLHNGYGVNSESDKDKIISMSKKYCGGSQNWINIVSNYYNDLKNKGFEHYYNKSNHDRSLNIPYNNE